MRSFILAIIAAVDLVELHDPQGGRVLINPHEIISMREPATEFGGFPKGTRCVIATANARVVAVRESCDAVRDQMVLSR